MGALLVREGGTVRGLASCPAWRKGPAEKVLATAVLAEAAAIRAVAAVMNKPRSRVASWSLLVSVFPAAHADGSQPRSTGLHRVGFRKLFLVAAPADPGGRSTGVRDTVLRRGLGPGRRGWAGDLVLVAVSDAPPSGQASPCRIGGVGLHGASITTMPTTSARPC